MLLHQTIWRRHWKQDDHPDMAYASVQHVYLPISKQFYTLNIHKIITVSSFGVSGARALLLSRISQPVIRQRDDWYVASLLNNCSDHGLKRMG